jgi:hypothetical protein
MPIEYTRAPAAVSPQISRQIGLLVLRLTVGGSLLYWQISRQLPAAWSHIWQKTEWELPGQLAGLGFPLPLPLAIALILLVFLTAMAIMLGLLTRLSAVLLSSVCVITALLYRHYPQVVQPALLLAGACCAICLCGAGHLAVDRLLRSATRRS